MAVLYLENHLAPAVFTPARIAVLQVLAPQAAMSLENSRLYRELELRSEDPPARGREHRRRCNHTGRQRIIDANDAGLEIVGYTREDVRAGRIGGES